MAFECIECNLAWLSQMTREAMAINAPVIEMVMGAEHMNKVRAQWKARRFTNSPTESKDFNAAQQRRVHEYR